MNRHRKCINKLTTPFFALFTPLKINHQYIGIQAEHQQTSKISEFIVNTIHKFMHINYFNCNGNCLPKQKQKKKHTNKHIKYKNAHQEKRIDNTIENIHLWHSHKCGTTLCGTVDVNK